MSKLLEEIKETVDSTIPEIEEISHSSHPKADYTFLIFRNIFVGAAVILFLLSFVIMSAHTQLRAVGYLFGAGAYLFECFAITDCFQKKVPHTEMFMVYCFGPVYLLMGLSYLF